MPLLAHIGGIPVQESLPFVVPVVVLFLYGRHWDRRRKAAVRRLPDSREALDERTVELVLGKCAAGHHEHVHARHLPVLYPPGPDGLTASELAQRAHLQKPAVEALIDELQELGYLDLDEAEPPDEPRAWLTTEGYDLVNLTESVLLAVQREAEDADAQRADADAGADAGAGVRADATGAGTGPRVS